MEIKDMCFGKITSADQLNVEYHAFLKIAKKSGLNKNKAIKAADRACRKHYGVSPLEEIGINPEYIVDDSCDVMLKALKKAGKDGVAECYMASTKPWNTFSKKERDDSLEILNENELAKISTVRTGKRGPARKVWIAINN